MFSLHKVHYPDLLKARCGAITDVYAAQLGHIAGYMFNRVATPGWEELNPGCTIRDRINSTLGTFEVRENERLRELLAKASERCTFSQCGNKAKTYRWLRVRSDNDESVSQEYVLCEEHAKQYDEGSLPQSAVLRSET